MIIGIDPGPAETAWCALNGGAPVGFDKVSNADMLIKLRNDLNPSEDFVAIEMIQSFGMAVGREVFETCLWIGRYIEAWERRCGKYGLVYRKDVKLFHCETVRATDSNIRASLLDRFGPGREKAVGTVRAPGPLHGMKGDCWAALAVGLTVHGKGVAAWQ